jgi:hypothetical protein
MKGPFLIRENGMTHSYYIRVLTTKFIRNVVASKCGVRCNYVHIHMLVVY